MKGLICGWGVNDVDYPVHLYDRYKSLCGKSKQRQIWICPYYADWVDMIYRCLYPKIKERNPTYTGCTITEEWKYLSNFIKWVDSQPNKDWQNCSPDKDFLIEGNKHYSPNTVVYISASLNRFIVDRGRDRGSYMIGVSQVKSRPNIFQSNCCNPFNKKARYIGYFDTELEAHKAWQAKKHEYACQLADLQEDPRVAKVLRERYAPDKDFTGV